METARPRHTTREAPLKRFADVEKSLLKPLPDVPPQLATWLKVKVQPGHDMLFITQTQLMASLRTAQAMSTYGRRLQYLSKVALLIIDDFGLKPLRPSEDEDFHDLIAERYERTSTILTSHRHFDEWGAAFGSNKMIGAASLDRLRHGAYKLVLDGESDRALPPSQEDS